jgi:hypothetical protein
MGHSLVEVHRSAGDGGVSDLSLYSQAIYRARGAVLAAHLELARAIYRTASRCKHSKIAECNYEHREYSSSSPPSRLCLQCGLCEEGWGCGYLVLNTAMPLMLGRDELFKLATVHIYDADKGPVLRREAVLSDLLRSKLGLGPKA